VRHLGSVTTRETFLFKPHALRYLPDVWLVTAEIKHTVSAVILVLQKVLSNFFSTKTPLRQTDLNAVTVDQSD